jgi:fucose permease
MVGQDYALTTTTFWIGLIAGEFPANRLIQILPLGKYLSAAVFLWSVCLMAMAFAKNAP